MIEDQKRLFQQQFIEVRRKSKILWNFIDHDFIHYKPDNEAMTVIEMIAHVLTCERVFHARLKASGPAKNEEQIWNTAVSNSVQEQLDASKLHRANFMNYLSNLTENDFIGRRVIIPERKQNIGLTDYLSRMIYHESVHTGQLMSYLRQGGHERPDIWI